MEPTAVPSEAVDRSDRRARRGALLYCVTALGFSGLLGTVLLLTGWPLTSGRGLALIPLLMWTPALARAVAVRYADTGFHAPLPARRWGPSRFLPLLLPLLAVLAVYGAAYVLGTGLGLCRFEPVWGNPLRTLVNLVVNLAGLSAMGLFGAIGEELGWRGYLQPRLDQAGVRGSVWITAFVEWLFHVPIILWGGYLSGMGVLPALVLFLGLKLGATFTWTWATYRTGTLWTAILFHTLHNAWSQSLFPRLFPGGDERWLGESGLLPVLAYAGFSLLLLLRMRRRREAWAELAWPVLGPRMPPELRVLDGGA
jgi:membrane protease YdiL (CAAX protease family)